MNTEEIVEKFKHGSEAFVTSNIFGVKITDIVEALERGEKFEKMWGELEGITGATEWEMVSLHEIKQKYFPELICGNCKFYDSDFLFCEEHPEYGELVEQDTCVDWTEDE